MKFSIVLITCLATGNAVASSWFGKAAYNKWHETELERWLSDHDIPYPTPADRKDLENLVKENWNSKVASPYSDWDTNKMQSYMAEKGHQATQGAADTKDSLLSQMKSYWYETEDQANDAWTSVKDWIFDTWSESQLKAFLDRHGIPNPQPHSRDSMLKSVRENYQSVANKVGETASYPGDWLYEQWSDSDLKAYLDERGIPVPQGNNRNKLVASVRRNARLAGQKMSDTASAAAASAQSGAQYLSDEILDSWSDSQIKEWADKNGIKVPQGSRRNELLALARKHRGKFSGDNVASSASSYYGAATSNVGNQFAKATDQASGTANGWIDWIKAQIGLGSKSMSSATYYGSQSATSAASGASASLSSAGAYGTESAKSMASGASGSAGSMASDASKSGSSVASGASGSAASMASGASGSAASMASAASASAASMASGASSAASAGTDSVKSMASGASGSAASMASNASKSGSSMASGASGAAASMASSASSMASGASKSVSSGYQAATDAAQEKASKAKHRASEAAQSASNRVKEEL